MKNEWVNNDQAEQIQCTKMFVEISDLVAWNWKHSFVDIFTASLDTAPPALCTCFRSLTMLLICCTQSTKCYSWKYQGGVQRIGSSFQMLFSRFAHDATITFLSSSDETSIPKLICGARTLNPQKCNVPCWRQKGKN